MFHKKNKSALVSLQRRSSTCRCELPGAFPAVWQPPRPFIQELPQSSPELQNYYKNFAAFAALREINQVPSLRQQQHVYVKNHCGLTCTCGRYKCGLFAREKHTSFTRKGIVPNCFTKKTNPTRWPSTPVLHVSLRTVPRFWRDSVATSPPLHSEQLVTPTLLCKKLCAPTPLREKNTPDLFRSTG